MSAHSSPLSSALSSPPGSDDEMLSDLNDTPPRTPSDMASSPVPQSASPASKKKKREPSPPHEEVLADNPDIAFIVMFRSRFSDAFPPKLINLGPQDIERGVVDTVPSPQVESLLCALLGLMLNRKKPVERGHYNRALEDAISSQKSQWPRAWEGVNPIAGTRTFNTIGPTERLSLLKAIIMWSLHSSEAISGMIKDSYKQNRHDDDMNQPLSVQSWGRDGDKRRYWLIEGRDDTPFRLYRESNPALKNITWRSIAGSIDELQEVAVKLDNDGSQAARRLSQRITAALSRFEATEEKRKRREYRMQRKAQFSRPEPGYSMYEGRTRGKRMKYTYSEDEDDFSMSENPEQPRRSARAAGTVTGLSTEPTTTASGRQTRPRFGNMYGDSGDNSRASPATDNFERSDGSEEPRGLNGGRPTRAAGRSGLSEYTTGRERIAGYNEVDEMDDEEDALSSGEDWDGDEELDDKAVDDDEEEESISSDDDAEPSSLVVKLHYGSRNTLKLPERLNPTPHQSPARPMHRPTDAGAMEVDSPVKNTALGSTNGSIESTKSSVPQSSIANFLYKPPTPAADGSPVPEHKPSSQIQMKPITPDETSPAHFHAPPVSVEALTGKPLAFTNSSNATTG
ncbi:hypothetical protein BT63DRAFT_424943 [Microthyrium microscopicum]|uniref:WHIM1 domain-containing protein n=1 Tax=Microthyrium microscopicum TaxID=703497 RepID=A0A6A6UC90_9PEZI|nr:hypothetical protein BT63DRAFT_424943 [Microthyrium microscopicum]